MTDPMAQIATAFAGRYRIERWPLDRVHQRLLGGSLGIVNPDSGAPRVLLDAATSGGLRVEQSFWSGDSRTIYFKSHDATGNAQFWSIPVTGGHPTLLTRFDDPMRPSYRPQWGLGPGRMYFTLDDKQSQVWVMDATPR